MRHLETAGISMNAAIDKSVWFWVPLSRCKCVESSQALDSFGQRCVLQLSPPQVEMDELHEEAQRYAADLKQGKVAEGKEALHGVAQDGTIATRLSFVPNVSTIRVFPS